MTLTCSGYSRQRQIDSMQLNCPPVAQPPLIEIWMPGDWIWELHLMVASVVSQDGGLGKQRDALSKECPAKSMNFCRVETETARVD
jgi:hypothetical protein